MIRLKSHPCIDMALKKRNKYGAVKCSYDGYTFDSMKEGKEYLRLRSMLQTGDISDLEVHPKYYIFVNSVQVCAVELDFVYHDRLKNKTCYIDIKGYNKKTRKFRVTPESKLKKKLLEAYKNIEVEYV